LLDHVRANGTADRGVFGQPYDSGLDYGNFPPAIEGVAFVPGRPETAA
jgi:hypothetical protein